MSQTDKERVIDAIVARFSEGGMSKGRIVSAAYDAGYRAAKEDAAQIAEHPYRLGEVDGSTKPKEVGDAVAAAIRKLEPKP